MKIHKKNATSRSTHDPIFLQFSNHSFLPQYDQNVTRAEFQNVPPKIQNTYPCKDSAAPVYSSQEDAEKFSHYAEQPNSYDSYSGN